MTTRLVSRLSVVSSSSFRSGQTPEAEGFLGSCCGSEYPEYSLTQANDFMAADLRDQASVARHFDRRLTRYTTCGRLGGAGYIFTGEPDPV